MQVKVIQVGISGGALLLVAARLIWPSLRIDGTTVMLIALALVPWLGSVLKSVELPGMIKFQYRDLQRAKRSAEEAGLLSPAATPERGKEYSFQQIAGDDPNLALAGLRIEIEKRLRQIAESRGIEPLATSAGALLRILTHKRVLSDRERAALSHLVGLLNSAVHGAAVDQAALDWAMDVGPQILRGLDEKRTHEAPPTQ
jgi:hypothetical protein